MSSKLQAAKHAFVTKDFDKAKELLLEIIASNEHENDHKYYHRLGDVYFQLGDYHRAIPYYQEALHKDTSNPSIFIKLANVFIDKINNNEEAEKILLQCHQLHPNNDQCVFKLAKLMENKDHKKARKLYIKCLSINDQKASTHYHLAKLYIQDSHNTQSTKYFNDIEYYLEQAITIKPKVALYQYEYAQHSQRMGKYNRANHYYKKALQLVDNNDTRMVREYHQFLITCIGNAHQAMGYLDRTEVKEDIGDDNKDQDREQNIKLVIYDFAVLTYWELIVSINELQNTSKGDLMKIFGWKSRIKEIRRHLASIRCSKQRPFVLILSEMSKEVTKEALKRIHLNEHVQDIFVATEGKGRIHDIIRIKDEYRIYDTSQVLYITKDITDGGDEDLLSQCSVYGVDESLSKPLRGASPSQFEEIGCIE